MKNIKLQLQYIFCLILALLCWTFAVLFLYRLINVEPIDYGRGLMSVIFAYSGYDLTAAFFVQRREYKSIQHTEDQL